MSIFSKRSSGPQMLFGGKPPPTPSTPYQANGNGRSAGRSGAEAEAGAPAADTRHSVFYVRGRPFIAPVGNKRSTPRQELFEAPDQPSPKLSTTASSQLEPASTS